MAYVTLGTRNTYYVSSGTSEPDYPDIRAYGTAKYEQTANDILRNRSSVRLEFGVYVPVTIYTKYTLTGKIQ